ncbi:MAG: phosphatase PAP2 family protein [Bacteroidaceae bacterium]|nr:phosphatase PAP2 family protein [Bacteroidaceae bacterium]
MAINIIKREEPQTRFLAVEKLNLLYNLFTTLLIIIFFNRLNDPQAMLLGRFFIAFATFAVIYVYTKFPSMATRLLRVVSQMALLSYWYPDTFEFNRIFPNLDHLFATLESDLFGCQPALLFDQVCSGLFWREAFNMGYWLYYPMIALVSFYYFFCRPKEAERCTFVIMASFFLYYIIYIFLPVAGPQFYFPVIGEEIAAAGPYPELGDYFNLHSEITIAQEGKGGLFTELVGMAQGAGERPTAAFPSSHIGVTTILVMLAYRAKKWLFAVMFPVYVLLCCATVYIKAHYLVDAIAGLVTGVLVYYLTTWLYKKFEA